MGGTGRQNRTGHHAVPAEGLALDMMVWTAVGLGFAILGAFWVVRGL